MRRWGPIVGALLLIGFIGNLFAPDEPSPTQTVTAAQTAEQTQSTEPAETSEPEPSEAASAGDPQATPQQSQSEEPVTESTTASPEPTQTSEAEPVADPETTESSDLADLLLALTIADEVTAGYDRDLFRHWVDADGDGCDARREVLITEAVIAPVVGSGCSLTGGEWYSVYDGQVTDDPSKFDVDHMVPLKEAWDSGANAWSSETRRAFANDLDLDAALIAVSASSNRSKSDKDPADWLPPLASYHCQYVEDWVQVKIKWQLSVDEREFAAIRSVLAGC